MPPFTNRLRSVAPSSSSIRSPRADSARNKAKIIDSAKQVFTDRGAAASLEQIARDAGVGIGTLYRHFPTRDALIEAVYRRETDTLVQAGLDLAGSKAPVQALREWLLIFVDFLETKQHLGEVIESLLGGAEALYGQTPAKLAPPAELLVERVEKAGLAMGIAPLDLLRAIVGVATVRPGTDWKQQAIALIDLLLRGARKIG